MGGSGGIVMPGGAGPTDEAACPRKFSAILVDVPLTDNAEYALALEAGEELVLQVIEMMVGVSHNDVLIGYLPPTYSEVAACIEGGWAYSGSIQSAEGTAEDPNIRITVVGFPDG